MQLYVADYLGDTRHLTTEQHGAYLLILMAMWRSGGTVPDDEAKLARIVGLSVTKWRKISSDVIDFFDRCEAGFTQKRLAAELAFAEEKSQKRSEAGKAGVRAKALKSNKAATANGSAMLKHSPEPEPDSKKENLTGSPKKGSRLPIDWMPSDADLDFAFSLQIPPHEVTREADKFRDHWIAQSGARGVKLDWPATWRNWCRNRRGAGPSGKPKANGNGSKPSGMAGILAERRRQASGPDDVSAGGRILPEDDGLSGIWINPGEPPAGAGRGSGFDDAPDRGQVRGMDSRAPRGNGSPW